jgi:hypothetical protein
MANIGPNGPITLDAATYDVPDMITRFKAALTGDEAGRDGRVLAAIAAARAFAAGVVVQPNVQISGTASKFEGASGTTSFTFTVTRSVSTGAILVPWTFDAGTTSAGDYVSGSLPIGGNVSIADGSFTGQIVINIAGDLTVEPDEMFTVSIATPGGYISGGAMSATGTVLNDDTAGTPTVQIVGAISRSEGNSGTNAYVFDVSRSSSSGAVNVTWSFAAGGTNASDYVSGSVPTGGTLAFADGVALMQITINVQGDVTIEGDEAFTVSIAVPSGYAAGASMSATGTILNDDTASPTVIISGAQAKAEGNSGVTAYTYTVTRSATSGAVSVPWSFVAGGTSADDFQGGAYPTGGTVNMANGVATGTFTVNVQGDATVEPDESFSVAIAAPSGYVLGTPNTATGTITNDDSAPVTSAMAADAPTMLSFGTRNGFAADPGDARYAVLPVLTNLFGTGTAAAAGALAMRVSFKPAEGYSTSYAAAPTAAINVMGTNGLTGGGTTACQFTPYGGSVVANRSKFYFTTKDTPGNTVSLYTPPIDPITNEAGIATGIILLRRDAAGVFTASLVGPDGTVYNGTPVTPSTWLGRGTAIGPMALGHFNGGSVPAITLGNYFSGAVGDFIQLDGSAGSDAEWGAVAAGADPAAVFGSSLAAHYPLRNATDLAKAAGSRSYAAATLGGTGHGRSGPRKPVRSTVDPTKSLYVRPVYRGYVHALDPAVVQAATDLNALKLVGGTVSRDIVVTGAATHIRARAIRKSDDVVVRDWTRVTTAAATGVVPVLLPNVPAVSGELRIEWQREDDTSFTCYSADDERVGLAVVLGPGQSQMAIAFRGGAANVGAGVPAEPHDYPANPNSMVSFCVVRAGYVSAGPADGGYMRHRFMLTNGMLAAAAWYESLNTGIPLEFIQLSIAGTSMTEWMYHTNTQNSVLGRDFWGDGATYGSGYVTDTLLAKRRRVTMFVSSWHTAERSTQAGGQQSFATIYGSRTVTERPWTERVNEFFGGIEKSTADATERGERSNLIDSNLTVFKPWLVIIPESRTSSGSMDSTASIAAGFDSLRKMQYDYAEIGTGKDAVVNATLGGFQNDIQMDGPSGPHQLLDDVYGNINFCVRMANAVVHAAKLSSLNVRPTISAVTGVGTAILTVGFTLVNGGALMTGASGAALTGFEVSTNGGTVWSAEGGTIPFTPTLVGNTVTLTKASGTWPAGTRVRYLPHFPVTTGSLATDRTAIKGMLYESRADMAVPNAAELPAGVPIRNSIDSIAAS